MPQKKYNSATIKGKLRVCQYVGSNSTLKRHVPPTRLFTRDNLKTMTRKYQAVYVKPNIGSMGIGVCKVKRVSGGYKLYYTADKKQITKRFDTVSSLYKYMKSKQAQKMIIQKDIRLDRVDGRSYDIRAMVQRRPRGKWTCTGYLIKVGAPKRIVTNYYQGGSIYTLDQLLSKKNYSNTKKKEISDQLKRKALAVSKVLSKRKAGMHEMGIDFAYDRRQRLWILEVNSNHPQYYPLRSIDPPAYKRMTSYARSYGRK